MPKDARFPQEVGKTEPNASAWATCTATSPSGASTGTSLGYPRPRQDNPTGPADGDKRVVRGGSFKTRAVETRSAARAAVRPTERRDDLGFRVVYAPVPK